MGIHECFPGSCTCTIQLYMQAVSALRRPHCIEWNIVCIALWNLMLKAHDQWDFLSSDFILSRTPWAHHGESMLHRPNHTSLEYILTHDLSSERKNTKPRFILMARSLFRLIQRVETSPGGYSSVNVMAPKLEFLFIFVLFFFVCGSPLTNHDTSIDVQVQSDVSDTTS